MYENVTLQYLWLRRRCCLSAASPRAASPGPRSCFPAGTWKWWRRRQSTRRGSRQSGRRRGKTTRDPTVRKVISVPGLLCTFDSHRLVLNVANCPVSVDVFVPFGPGDDALQERSIYLVHSGLKVARVANLVNVELVDYRVGDLCA